MIRQKDFIVILIRLFLGYIFLSSGLCKLTHGHFGQIIGPPFLEDTLARYGLGLFARIVATLQVVCGILLLSQRFSTLGAIMLVPMNISILAVTISMNWKGTPYVNGFFTVLNILLLVYDWHKLKILIFLNRFSAVKPTMIDMYGNHPFNLAGVAMATAALIASGFSILFTNAFAIAAFAGFGYSFIRLKAVGKIQVLIVLLVLLNMILITLAGRLLPFVQKMVFCNTLLILVLTGLLIFKFFRSGGKLITGQQL